MTKPPSYQKFTILLLALLLAALNALLVFAGFPTENFDTSTGWGSSYYSGDITFNSGVWNVANDYKVPPSEEAYGGSGNSHRLDDNVAGYVRTHQFTNGAGTFSFYAATWDATDITVKIEKSPDGSAWTTVADNFTIAGSSKAWSQYQVDVNDANAQYLKISKSGAQERLSLDEFSISNYAASAGMTLSKSAPAQAAANSAFTYTLTLANNTGITLTTITLTDTIPLSVTYISNSASNGGTAIGGVISWSIASLADGGSLTRTFQVTAPTQSGVSIVNNNYAVAASNWLTPAAGSPVTTMVSGAGGCGQPYTPIYQIQGSGDSSSMDGDTVAAEGVVVGVFPGLNGFAIQDVTGDGNAATSDGIFIYQPGASVAEGDLVLVSGVVDEFNNLTEINNVSAVTVCGASSVAPTAVTMPFSAADDMEKYEGMLVEFPQTLYVTDHYNLARYGQIMLSSGGRLMNPTNVITPGQPAIDLQAANDLNLIYLDDADTTQNPDPLIHPLPAGLSASNTLRGGDTIAGMTGVAFYSFGEYMIEPVSSPSAIFTHSNPRPTAPEETGGGLKVASFNVLNYFNGDGLGGGFPTSRGADTLAEFNRQRAKIITAVVSLNADVIGLMEIENDGYGANSAIQDLVNGLNAVAGAGTYAFVDPGVTQIGSDEIAVGLLYKPATVALVGSAAILDSTVDPNFIDTKNRPALAQTFMEQSSGEKLTVAVNHLKSKGSSCDSLGDPDTGDGQGNCNLTRTSAMTAETSWLAGDPTNSGDPDYLIIGDLNSYAMEDPISAAKNAGYVDLLAYFQGESAYSYVYKGQWGHLDYGLANSSLLLQVFSAAAWHINADEPRALDYNVEYKSAAQVTAFYAPDAYRASDHDPVLVNLKLGNTPVTYTLKATPIGSGTVTLNHANGVYNTGETAVLTAAASSGWVFDGWSGNLSGNTTPAALKMTTNAVVTATFSKTPVTYTLSVAAVGQGQVRLQSTENITGSGSLYQTVFTSGAVVTATAYPDSGWLFSDWSGDAGGTSTVTTVVMTADKTITATFTQAASSIYLPLVMKD